MGWLGRAVAWVIGVALLAGSAAALLHAPAVTAQVGENGGSAWGLPIRLSGNVSCFPEPDVAVDFYGNAVAIWDQPDCSSAGASIWTSRFIHGGGWTPARQLAASQQGAFSPHVAMAPSGIGMAVWAGNGSIWASEFVPEFAGDPRVGWSEPVPLRGGGGMADWPAVTVDGSGRTLVVWQEYDANATTLWADWFIHGSGWGPAEQIGGTGGWWAPQVAVLPTGMAMVVWAGPDSARYERLWVTSFDPVAGWAAPIAIDQGGCPMWVDLATSYTGYAFVTWHEEVDYPPNSCGSGPTNPRYPIYVAVFDPGQGWQAAAKGPDGSQPQITADGEQSATVVWCDRGTARWSCGGVWMSRFVAGAGWSNSTLVTDDWGMTPPATAADPFGNTVVVWSHTPVVTDSNGTRLSVQGANLMASRFLPGGGQQPPVAISSAFGAGQVIALDGAGDPMVVWAGWVAPEENASLVQWSVWSNRFLSNADSLLPPAGTLVQPAWTDPFVIFGALALAASALAVSLVSAFRRRLERDPREVDGPVFRPSTWIDAQQTGRRGRPGSRQPARVDPAPTSSADPPRMDWPKADGPLHLTVRERILLHLLESSRYADAVEVPTQLTQAGISRSAAVNLRHIAQYMRPMVTEGLVRERRAHVRGLAAKHKVYVLADGGRRVASGVRDRIRSSTIRFRDESGVHESTVGDVLAMRRGISVLEVVRESIDVGVVDLRAR